MHCNVGLSSGETEAGRIWFETSTWKTKLQRRILDWTLLPKDYPPASWLPHSFSRRNHFIFKIPHPKCNKALLEQSRDLLVGKLCISCLPG